MLTVVQIPKQKQNSLQDRDYCETHYNKESFLKLFIIIYGSKKNKDS